MFGWLRAVVHYFASSISKKIIIPYAVLTVLLAAMGIFIVTRLVATSFEDRLKNQLLEAGRVVSDEVVNRERFRLEVERTVVNTIGVADAVVDRDYQQLEALIFPIIANSKGIDSIVILDTQSKELLRFHRDPDGFVITSPERHLDYSEWPTIKQILANPEGQKEAQLARDPATGELIIYTIGPIQDSEGVVGAALVGTYLDKEIQTLQSLALAQLVLFNKSGEVMASTFGLDEQENEEVFSIFTPERYHEVMRSSEEVTLLDEVDIGTGQTSSRTNVTVRDRNYRLAYAPFILRGRVYGIFAVALTTNFITDTTGQSQLLLVTIFTIGGLAVFGVGYAISRVISRPILQLARTARSIAEGNLEQQTGVQGEDEVGVLAATFDAMTAELRRLLKIQQEEASKLNAILNSIADGVLVQSIEGDILVKNPAAQKILDKMEESNARVAFTKNNKTIKQLSSDTDVKTFLRNFTNLEFEETDRVEVGRQVLSTLSAPVFTPDGNQLGNVVVLRDITREVESEKLKDEFITSISHELKTPLTAIKGYNSLLKMMLEMKPSEDKMGQRQMSIVNTMDKELTDLDNLIQAMLDLSQIDAGELGVDREPLDLTELIREEVQNWSDKLEERELQLNSHLPSEPIWVAGDHNRLTRVLHHLMKNAHDYTLPGGDVEVQVTRKNGKAQVHVIDTGVGIAKEQQRYLYTRFFRAIHDESTYEVSGAGLGLYTSKAIVEAHDGEMWMESQVNEGSTFSFAIPVIDPDAKELDEPKNTPNNVESSA
ncbi:MAG: HAMP domain-containing protein [Anaerolineae bacterium]|nr:HAMP domain-containing protein [Anaerolineae bacterium]